MNYSILLVFDRPDLSHPEKPELWRNFSEYAEGIAKQDKSIQWLGINALLIRVDTSLDKLLAILARSNSDGLTYKYSIFPEEIKWNRQF